MEPILKKTDKTDPFSLTELRNSQRDNKNYDLEVDVEFENLIIAAIRNRIKQGSQEDFKPLIIENLMMVYNDDEELSVLNEMFKMGNKPILRANDWCRPHLQGTPFDYDKNEMFKALDKEQPQMVKLFWDLLV